jgi:hypothetical protein
VISLVIAAMLPVLVILCGLGMRAALIADDDATVVRYGVALFMVGQLSFFELRGVI